MKEAVAGFVTVATAFIAAGIIYQVVKPGSQGPVVTGQVARTFTSLSSDLFKG